MTTARIDTFVRIILMVLITVGFARIAPAQDAAPIDDGARALLDAAHETFRAAEEASTDDPGRARVLYEEAAGAYEALIRDEGAVSASSYRSLGVARLLSGDVGRAVLNLRRSERLDPQDARTRASLEHARARVRTQIAPDLGERALDVVLWWRGVIPRSALFAGFVGAFGACWIVASLRLLARGRPRGPWVISLGGIALVLIGSLIAERVVFESDRSAVVLDASIARTGPSAEVYPPAFEDAISPGVEATIAERRDGWARLRLPDGREGWVPEPAVARVTPAEGP